MHIAISAAERAVERLTDQHIQQAAQALAKEGFVVLNQAVAHSYLDILHEQMLTDTHTLVAARDRGEEISGWKYGHLQQKPPHQKPYIFRDIRLWHRGVPNQSDQIRHMIAMVHQVRWFRKAQTLQFQKGCEAEFANDDLDHNAEFIDGPVEYLFSPHLNHS